MAIVLSVAIMLGWQFYIEQTTPPPSDKTAEQTGSPVAPGNSAGGSTGSALTPPAPAHRTKPPNCPVNLSNRSTGGQHKLCPGSKLSPPRHRVPLACGARFDDLTLEDYRESIEPDSEKVTLLKPFGTDNAYYAYYGWVSCIPRYPRCQMDNGPRRAGPRLSGHAQWTNKDGVVFQQIIALDEHYMFTVQQRVTNGSNKAANVSHSVKSSGAAPQMCWIFTFSTRDYWGFSTAS